MKSLLSFCLSVFITVTFLGQDTFSIVAVDTVTGEVGSAGATCLDNDDIEGGALIISDVHPGVGAIHTQSFWLPQNQQYAKQLMDAGYSPQQIIDSLVANDAQNNPTTRQYGIVDLFGSSARSAAFTGVNCLNFKGHITGPNYAIQGNILLNEQILDSMEAGFLNTEGSLACKLMAALQGANVPGADSRCLSNGTSSLSAFLRVAQPEDDDDTLYLDFRVPKVFPGTEPIDQLQVLVDNWGVCIETNVAEMEKESAIQVYPNPARDIVNFSRITGQPFRETILTIYDVRGNIVFESTSSSSVSLSWDTQQTSPGLYLWVIRDNQTMTRGKLLVE